MEFPRMLFIICSTVDVTSCTYNLAQCHADETGCRAQAARMIDACAWNVSGGHCDDVTRCRSAVRRFYEPDEERLRRALLFCRCERGDQPCTSVRRAFLPACTAIQLPPPSCRDVIDTCNQEAECRSSRIPLTLPAQRCKSGCADTSRRRRCCFSSSCG